MKPEAELDCVGKDSDFEVIPFWSGIDLFRDLTPEELREIRKDLTTISRSAGQILYSPGDWGECLYILVSGNAQLYRMSPGGRKLLIESVSVGRMFGEMIMTGEGHYDSFAQVIEDSVLWVLKKESMRKLILNPSVAIGLMNTIGNRLRDAEERLERSLFQAVPNRLAAVLLWLRDQSGTNTIKITHEELAEWLGVYRETVTNALNRFGREGTLSTGRGAIELKDLIRLEHVALG